MHEAIDYNALSWVRQGLDVTLRQAHAMLVEYSGNKESTELLHGYAELLHQMRGPLQIAELDGADLLEPLGTCQVFVGEAQRPVRQLDRSP